MVDDMKQLKKFEELGVSGSPDEICNFLKPNNENVVELLSRPNKTIEEI